MDFRERIRSAVARIPKGRVATYAQVAQIAGYPVTSARAVGNAIHSNTDPVAVPCHRVVNSQGFPGSNYGMGGPEVQRQRLEAEGVTFIGGHVDMDRCGMTIERHPLEPFLPENGRILFLGSFPPPKARWSMDFFYPNWINDFWRIMGLLHHQDAHHFEIPGEKRFDKDAIVEFCETQGLAFFDTATSVCRLKGNASDNFLEILEPTDVSSLLLNIPGCETIVTTGGKASEELAAGIGVESIPPVEGNLEVSIGDRRILWWRMPSSSRAFPMSLEKKASAYRKLFL